MQKWEYLTMSFKYFESHKEFFLYLNDKMSVIDGGKFKPIEIMNQLGEEGWELVLGNPAFNELTHTSQASLTFKRPKH